MGRKSLRVTQNMLNDSSLQALALSCRKLRLSPFKGLSMLKLFFSITQSKKENIFLLYYFESSLYGQIGEKYVAKCLEKYPKLLYPQLFQIFAKIVSSVLTTIFYRKIYFYRILFIFNICSITNIVLTKVWINRQTPIFFITN